MQLEKSKLAYGTTHDADADATRIRMSPSILNLLGKNRTNSKKMSWLRKSFTALLFPPRCKRICYIPRFYKAEIPTLVTRVGGSTPIALCALWAYLVARPPHSLTAFIKAGWDLSLVPAISDTVWASLPRKRRVALATDILDVIEQSAWEPGVLMKQSHRCFVGLSRLVAPAATEEHIRSAVERHGISVGWSPVFVDFPHIFGTAVSSAVPTETIVRRLEYAEPFEPPRTPR